MIMYTTQHKIKKQAPEPLLCPDCNRSRICDAPAASRTRIIYGYAASDWDGIVIKCPKCGKDVNLTIS